MALEHPESWEIPNGFADQFEVALQINKPHYASETD